jgi:hypothetical protein
MLVILKIFSKNLRLFLQISILFEDIFREIEAFLKLCEDFQKIIGFFKTFKEKLRLFLVM